MITWNHRMLLTGMVLSLIGSAAIAELPDNGLPVPPEPDPYHPVDYIQWYNDVYGVSASDNAAALYRQAYELAEDSDFDWGPVTGEPWTDNASVRSWLDENREAMEVFKDATLKPDCLFALQHPDSECRLGQAFFNVLLPTLYKHRTLVRAWIAEGYHAAAGGNEELLIDNALIALRSGHHLDQSAILIEHLVGIACNHLSYTAMLNALDLSGAPEALAAEALPHLVRDDRPIPNLSKTFLSERLFLLDVAQRLYVPDEETGELTLLDPKSCPGDEETASYFDMGVGGRWLQFAIGFERTVAEANAHHDLLVQWVNTPYVEAREMADDPETRAESTINPLLRLCIPSLARARELSERCETMREGTRTVYRIFAYKNELQQFPESLNDLGLDALPIDMYTGKPLIYRKTGEGFMLYSCGNNAADDRGDHDDRWGDEIPDGDYVFWPQLEQDQ